MSDDVWQGSDGTFRCAWVPRDRPEDVAYHDTLADEPSSTPEAVRLTAALEAAGLHFVGPVSVYAYMQSTGIVNDHLAGCFRAHE